LRPRTALGITKSKFRFGLLFIFLLIPFLPWTSFTVGQGQVSAINPNERIQSLTATVNGFIGKWHIKEGDPVTQGQVLADIVDNDPSILDRYQQEKDAALAAVNSSKLMMDTAQIDLERQRRLFERGLSARKDYEKARIEYSKLNVEYSKNLAILTKAETQLSRQASQKVLAPSDGVVTKIFPAERGQLIKSGSPIAVFAPKITLPALEVWIAGNDVALLERGQKAMVQFEGWPSVQIPGWPSLAIGAFQARVHLVDQASSSKGKFRVLLIPADKWPSQHVLRLGSHGKAYIHLSRNSVGWELWRQLNSFPAYFDPIEEELINLSKEDKE
jgi:multidrug efflux pump subunit AcrA (membrane-fusion protein)